MANNVLQSGNNQLRVEAENQLKLLRDSKPNELVVLFLALLESKTLQQWSLGAVLFA